MSFAVESFVVFGEDKLHSLIWRGDRANLLRRRDVVTPNAAGSFIAMQQKQLKTSNMCIG